MTGYIQTRKDFEYLETIIEIDDTVACFMDNVVELMENPTKKYAQEMYTSGIEIWCTERKFDYVLEGITPKQKRRINSIKIRHYITD